MILVLEYDPNGQGLHCNWDNEDAPVTLEYDPVGQGIYVLDPDWQ